MSMVEVPELGLRGASLLIRARGGFIGKPNDRTGKPEVPGGRVEAGEYPRWTAFRECVEEVGVTPLALRLLVEAASVTDSGAPYRALVYLGVVAEDVIPSDEPGERLRVYTREELCGPGAQYPAVMRLAFEALDRLRHAEESPRALPLPTVKGHSR